MGSNHRPADYESAALPLSYAGYNDLAGDEEQVAGIDPVTASYPGREDLSTASQESGTLSRTASSEDAHHRTRANGSPRIGARGPSIGTHEGSCSFPYTTLAVFGTCART